MDDSGPGFHTVARFSVAVAILLMALAAAIRMPLDYFPVVTLPQVTVALTLPGSDAADAAETSARWAVPIETAIRSSGDVAAVRGWVGANGLMLDVRFRRGVDPELKTARITSELGSVRRMLPPAARLRAWPSRRSGEGAELVMALVGQRASALDDAVADDLRGVAGIRDVAVYGGTPRITAVTIRDAAGGGIDADAVRAAMASMSSTGEAGHVPVGSRSIPVNVRPASRRLEEVPVRLKDTVVSLRSVATVTRKLGEPSSLSWRDGRPAVFIEMTRDPDVSLLAFDRRAAQAVTSLARRRGARAEVIWSEAALLRKLMLRLAIACAAGILFMAAAGWLLAGWSGTSIAAQPPLAVCCCLNLFWMAGLPLDAKTLLAAAIAIAASAPFVMIDRFATRGTSLLAAAGLPFAILLPIAIAFGSGRLAPFLSRPAIAFALASIAAVAAARLTGPPPATRGGVPAEGASSTPRRRFRMPLPSALLRQSPTVVLVAGTVMWGLLSWFGPVLDPREPDRGDSGELNLRIALPAASTLAQTAGVVEPFAARLRSMDGVRHFWSTAEPGTALLTIELTRDARPRAATDLLRDRLRRLPIGAALLTIDDSAPRRAMSMTDDDEEKATAEPDGSRYRVVVRSGNVEDLRTALDRIDTRLTDLVGSRLIHPQWAPLTSRIELRPHLGSEARVTAAAAALRERSLPPSESEAGDGSLLRVIAPHSPASPDAVPFREDLLGRPLETPGGPLVIASSFAIDHRFVVPRVERELGRFVLPIEMFILAPNREEIVIKRQKVDRALSRLALPAGTTITRPSLSAWTFSSEKLRMVALASFIPILLATLAASLLNSVAGVVLVAVPAALGLALATPLLFATRRGVDELTLFAIAAAVCWVSALATATALRALRASSGLATLRATVRQFPPAAAGALVAGLLLIGTGLSGDRVDDVWSTPLLAAGVVASGGGLAAAFLPAALLLTARDLRRRATGEARQKRNPIAWLDPGTPTLTVRSLSKRYRSGFEALHRINFELGPGITGLLGANGAGKTTLLRIISGLLAPTRGQVLFCGVPVEPENLARYRQSIGFLPQEFNAYPGFTAAEFLDHWALERGISSTSLREKEVMQALASVHLEHEAGRRVRDFSGGMRQRIGIARALLAAPPLLIVDEPTTGLDIESRQQFREIIRELGRDRLVVLSTHLTADVEAVAGRLLLLHRGLLRFDGPPALLVERAAGSAFESVVDESEARRLSRIHRLTARVRVGGGIRVRGVTAIGEAAPGPHVEPTLEEAFLIELQRADQSTGHRPRGFSFLRSQPGSVG
jgi:ABC-2 type transport system ATP-binding protein